ncbi:MAG: hypothetical protein L7V86_17290, partial [Verrucomicrobiales bacterium]|nr:hypothetical protein [Verrucomicrobiales bacterium]
MVTQDSGTTSPLFFTNLGAWQYTYLPEFRCAFLYDPMSTETPRWLYADDEFLTARDFETEISFP